MIIHAKQTFSKKDSHNIYTEQIYESEQKIIDVKNILENSKNIKQFICDKLIIYRTENKIHILDLFKISEYTMPIESSNDLETGGFSIYEINERKYIVGCLGNLFIMFDKKNPEHIYTQQIDSVSLTAPLIIKEDVNHMFYIVTIDGQLHKYKIDKQKDKIKVHLIARNNTNITANSVIDTIKDPIIIGKNIIYFINSDMIVSNLDLSSYEYTILDVHNLAVQQSKSKCNLITVNNHKLRILTLNNNTDLDNLQNQIENNSICIDDAIDYKVNDILANENLIVLTSNDKITIYEKNNDTFKKVSTHKIDEEKTISINIYENLVAILSNNKIHILYKDEEYKEATINNNELSIGSIENILLTKRNKETILSIRDSYQVKSYTIKYAHI